MCGIAGRVAWESGPALDAMLDALRHRGPDGRGIVPLARDGAPLGEMGACRLAITDPHPRAGQPLASADGRWTLVYNGEVYNWRKLRAELEAQGARFRTDGDTEVVLEAVARWGLDALPRLDGMWAFALWDRDRATLLLARDRFGIKPLYYRRHAAGLAFASEARALLPPRPRVDSEQLHQYLQRGVPEAEGRTMFAAVRSLPAGCLLEWNGSATTPRPWWRYPERRMEGGDARRLRTALAEAVAECVPVTGPCGFLVSGGLDSSTVALLGAPHARGRAVAFCADLGAEAAQRRVTERAGLEAIRVPVLAEEFAAEVDACIRHQEIPFPDYPRWCVARAARAASVRVLLGGDGGDELLAGYPYLLRAHLRGLRSAGRRLRYLRALAETRWQGLRRRLAGGRRRFAGAPPPAGDAPDLATALRGVVTVDPLPRFLHVDDRSAMAWSLEIRHPLLTAACAEVALAVDPADLVRGGRTKSLLRQAVADLLPRRILDSPLKSGFKLGKEFWRHDAVQAVQARGLRDLADSGFPYLDPEAPASPPPRLALLGIWARIFDVRWSE